MQILKVLSKHLPRKTK